MKWESTPRNPGMARSEKGLKKRLIALRYGVKCRLGWSEIELRSQRGWNLRRESGN